VSRRLGRIRRRDVRNGFSLTNRCVTANTPSSEKPLYQRFLVLDQGPTVCVSNPSPFSFYLINSIAIRAAAQTPVQMEFLGGTGILSSFNDLVSLTVPLPSTSRYARRTASSPHSAHNGHAPNHGPERHRRNWGSVSPFSGLPDLFSQRFLFDLRVLVAAAFGLAHTGADAYRAGLFE
jgi:hypothetical protein